MGRTKHHSPKYKNQSKGNFDIAYHLEMVSDNERLSLFKKGIDKVVKRNSIFCELGCGTGIFSIYAAQKAETVYAIEYDKHVIEFARKNIEKLGNTNKIKLIYGNALDIKIPERVDVVFCEMMSIWLIEEPQVLAMNHARRCLLKPGGVTIPRKIINLAELCHTDYKFGDIELRAPIVQFTGINHPRIMSESKTFNSISFDNENPEKVDHEIEFKILTTGVINSVRLSSIVNIADGINFYSTDTLMPLTIVPLRNEIFVREGQNLLLIAKYRHRDSLNNAIFEVRVA